MHVIDCLIWLRQNPPGSAGKHQLYILQTHFCRVCSPGDSWGDLFINIGLFSCYSCCLWWMTDTSACLSSVSSHRKKITQKKKKKNAEQISFLMELSRKSACLSVTRLDVTSVAPSYRSACHLRTCRQQFVQKWTRRVLSDQQAVDTCSHSPLQGFSSALLDLICMYDTLLGGDFPCLLNNDMTLIGRLFLSRGCGEPQELRSPLDDSRCTVIRERNYRRSCTMD